MINSLSTILLCFELSRQSEIGDRSTKCRSLTRRNDGALSDITSFDFDAEFEANKVAIPDSAHRHWYASLANYLGLPMVLGGLGGQNKLEILNTTKSPPAWIEYEGTNYPYSDT